MGFWEMLFFWMFAFGALASSVAVVAFRNPLYSAISLILDFFFFAGLYGLLSAHFMAIIQVLVYAGAIMVLFLFIIMLLNLKEDELGIMEFRLHHVLALATVVGFATIVISVLMPLVDLAEVKRSRAAADAAYVSAKRAYDAEVLKAKGITDLVKRAARLRELERGLPTPVVRTRTAVKGPLFADLNESGLELEYGRRIASYKSQRSSPAQGKYRRFDDSKPMFVPPSITGEELRTERGYIRAKEPAKFGTVEPLSIAIVNRFVVPFELAALLLLGAIIGAVIIAKRRI